MSISPVSGTTAIHGSQPVKQQPPQKPSPAQSPADTVHLSPAALARLKGSDADRDGDAR